MKDLIRIFGGAAIISIMGPLSIDMQGYVPITLQSLAVILIPMIFGWRNGMISIVIYLILGGFGLPVFADFSGGWDKFIGKTAGFLFGFLPAGFLAGFWAEKAKVQYARYFFIFLGAHVALLAFGVIGLLLSGVLFDDIWGTVKLLFPGLMIKSFIGGILVLAVKMNHETPQPNNP